MLVLIGNRIWIILIVELKGDCLNFKDRNFIVS